jgi:hypothetical protein
MQISKPRNINGFLAVLMAPEGSELPLQQQDVGYSVPVSRLDKIGHMT